MDQRELEVRGLIEPVQYGPGQIAANLSRAARDLTTATATMQSLESAREFVERISAMIAGSGRENHMKAPQ